SGDLGRVTIGASGGDTGHGCSDESASGIVTASHSTTPTAMPMRIVLRTPARHDRAMRAPLPLAGGTATTGFAPIRPSAIDLLSELPRADRPRRSGRAPPRRRASGAR